MAEGVGTAKIVGRVHMVDVNIGGSYLPCSISVLDSHVCALTSLPQYICSRQPCIRDPGFVSSLSCRSVCVVGQSIT